MDLSIDDVKPFLTPKQAADSRVSAWLTTLAALLQARYGSRITEPLRPIFVNAAADAIGRRVDKGSSMIDQQSVGAASVRWNPRSAIAAWFLPEEIAQLDEVAQGNTSPGARTHRMAAPYGQRFGNLTPRRSEDS
jgi:hypothetical protein